ncbi:MAG: hypothetical protein DRI97_11080 [Bacteroidetes bacterium]|nr:MAG: hypothetical protein DRI97_11080 [Bacteroidota bacterium]
MPVITLSPTDYINIIDNQFHMHKKLKTSRLSVEWGSWSRAMNLETRAIIENPESDPQTVTLLKYVFSYWILRSQLLDLHHKSSILHVGRRRKLVEECTLMRDMILKEENQPGSGGLPVNKDGFSEIAKELII